MSGAGLTPWPPTPTPTSTRWPGWVRDALANHPPGLPKSIGGPENQLARVRTLLHDRRPVLRNQVRSQRLLDADDA